MITHPYKTGLMIISFWLSRRLCPDMAFFQRPTEYPCLLILDPQNEFETLRKRVEQTTLKSQTVARNRSGVTNVSGHFGCRCLRWRKVWERIWIIKPWLKSYTRVFAM